MSLRTLTAATLTILAGAGMARADMVTYFHTQPPVMTDFDFTVNFPKFNPNDAFGNGTNVPGVLQSVILKGDWTLSSTVSLENLTPNPIMIQGQVNSAVSIRKADNTILTSGSMLVPFGPVMIPGNQVINLGPLNDATTTMATFDEDPDLAPFIGPGMIPIHLLADAGLDISGGGGGFFAQILSQVGTDVQLTYVFVPEPASLTLLAAGLTPVLLRRRRGTRG